MKLKKRFLALGMAVAMAATMAACGDSQKTGDNSKTEDNSKTGDGSKTEDNTGEIVTIQWYGMDKVPQWMNDYLAEEIGVMIEGIPSDPEKTQAMLAAGNLPDIGYYWDQQRDITQAIKSGGIMDLAPYLDQLPNVTENVPEMVEYMKDSKSAGNGGLYGVNIGTGFDGGAQINTGCYAANVRWDIYKKAGSPEVTDLKSYLECLKKMQEVYPETEDGIKTYGMSIFAEWDGIDCVSTNKFLTISGMLESNIGYNHYDIVNDKLEPMIEEGSHYMEALKLFFEANQMGILDPDSMSMKFQDSQAKLENGSTLSAGWGQYPEGYNTPERTQAEEPAGYMPLMWEGQYPVVVGEQKLGRDPLSVSSTTKHLDACLKLINFLYDYDANLVLQNGPQGFLWDIEDGKLVMTEYAKECARTGEKIVMENGEVYENPYANFPAIMPGTIHPKYNQTLGRGGWEESIAISLEGNKLMEDWSEFYGAATPSEWLRNHEQLISRPSAYELIEPIPDDLAVIQDSVKEVIKEKSWQMIYAEDEAEFDKLYKEMREEADGLGLQDLVRWGEENWAQAQAKVDQYFK